MRYHNEKTKAYRILDLTSLTVVGPASFWRSLRASAQHAHAADATVRRARSGRFIGLGIWYNILGIYRCSAAACAIGWAPANQPALTALGSTRRRHVVLRALTQGALPMNPCP